MLPLPTAFAPTFLKLPLSRQATVVVCEDGRSAAAHFGASWEPATAPVLLRAGEKLGKYEVRRLLGRGGQALTYLAFDPDLERPVVLKLYHRADSPERQIEVLKEGRALARVRSPFVAQCFGAERAAVGFGAERAAVGFGAERAAVGYGAERASAAKAHGVYLILEYVEGRTLAEMLDAQRLDLVEALLLVARVAQGVARVHACGLVHRDIKPANIIVGADRLPRLVDFGMAERVASRGLESISGTPAYMAPEQARGDAGRVGPASDVFGLGAVLYELLTGRPPYQGADPEEVLAQARRARIAAPRSLRPELPLAVSRLCMRCLAEEPEQRFPSSDALRRALQQLLEGLRRRRWTSDDPIPRPNSCS
jgi:serine/threonine-protein kinase